MNGLRRLTSGLPLFPLTVLSLLFFFDEWDSAAFAVLAPNIQHAFHLTDRAFGTLVMAIASSMLVERTARGDRMFLCSVERACAQIDDLDALELLP